MLFGLTVLILLSTGYEEEIREDCDWLFAIEKGAHVSSVSSDLISEPGWLISSLDMFVLSGDSICISVLSNEGNGAVLAAFRKTEQGFVFLDEFTSFFGRNRIVFSLSHPFISASDELFFRLEWTAYMGGYCIVESDESSYLEVSELSSFFIMVTDGESLRTEYDHRPATPSEE